MPLSGWAMVSVSTLNIDTLLFNRIQLPHLPLLEWLNIIDRSAQEALEHRFHSVHHVAGTVLIVMLIVHVSAALKHHYVDKDDVLSRMKPRITEPGFFGVLAFAAVLVGASVFALYKLGQSSAAPMIATGSKITAIANVTSDPTLIVFPDSNVVANIDLDNPSASSLEATIETVSASSDNLQVQGSLPEPEWLDSINYPTASFIADSFTAGQEVNTLDVTGQLSIKEAPATVSFTLTIIPATDTEPSMATAQFPVDRTALNLGLASQPDTDYVGSEVLIQVEFELSAGR